MANENDVTKIDSGLNNFLTKKYLFNNKVKDASNKKDVGLDALEEHLKRNLNIPHSVKEYIINIYNNYNNKICDPYEYIAYLDLFKYLDWYKEYLFFLDKDKKAYNVLDFIGDNNRGINSFYNVIKIAYENRMFSSYYLSYEVSELNLMYSGGSVRQIMTFSWIYKEICKFVNPDKENRIDGFLLANNEPVISAELKTLPLEEKSYHIAILKTNFEYLFKPENLLSVIFSEIYFINLSEKYLTIYNIMESEKFLYKLKNNIVSKQRYVKDESEFYIEIIDLLNNVFMSHVVKDFLSLNFTFKNDFNAFSFWSKGICLSDRNLYDNNLELKESSTIDILLRHNMAYFLFFYKKHTIFPTFEKLKNFNESLIPKESIYIKDLERFETILKVVNKFTVSFFQQNEVKKLVKELNTMVGNLESNLSDDKNFNLKEILEKINTFLLYIYNVTDLPKDKKSINFFNYIKNESGEEKDMNVFFNSKGTIDYTKNKEIKGGIISKRSELMYELHFLASTLKYKAIYQ